MLQVLKCQYFSLALSYVLEELRQVSLLHVLSEDVVGGRVCAETHQLHDVGVVELCHHQHLLLILPDSFRALFVLEGERGLIELTVVEWGVQCRGGGKGVVM